MHNDIITQTEQALARIFAICDDVAKTGETIRSEKDGAESAKAFYGSAYKRSTQKPDSEALDPASAGCALDGVSVHIKGFAEMPEETQQALAMMAKHLVSNHTKKPTGGAALVDAQSAQNDADESKTSDSAVHPFDWTEEEWRKDGFGAQHTEALHLLDEARQHFRLS